MRCATIGWVAGLFLGCLVSPLVLAQSAWDLVFRDQLDWTNREHRLILARDLTDRISLLESTLPEFDDRARAWVENLEQRIERLGDDAASSERGKLYLSHQYQHRALLGHMEQLQRELACTRQANALSREMVCWGRVAVYLLDGDRIGVALGTLRDRRLMPRSREVPFKAHDPVLWYAEFGRGIVEYLLVPYLASRAESDEPALP